jgi:perosamine synthetase
VKRIPVAGPSITDLEVRYVAEAARSDWYEGAGAFNKRFEKAFAEYVGVAHAISLPSCTSGLHLSLAALGIGPGDEVIVPDLTWIASAAPITYVGAEPVFADVDPVSWCLSPEAFEAAITPRTKAVIPVDLYGNMVDFDALLPVARRHGIWIVEDSAEAMGSRLGAGVAGSFGDTGVFSFHGSKTMTTGEGGMVVTDDAEIYARMMVLRDHGRNPGDVAFFNSEVAYKYKMSGVQAALGLAQLERIEELVAKKRIIFRLYQKRLGHIDGFALNPERDGERNSFWMSTLVWSEDFGLHKDKVMLALAERGIDSRPFFHPLSSLPAYAKARDCDRARTANRQAYRIGANGINLPCAQILTEQDVDRVCDAVLEVFGLKGGLRASRAG